MEQFLNLIKHNRAGKNQGIYAVCTAHPIVLEAAFTQAKQDDSLLLIEATANQVNQFGGYTGMRPVDFPPFVEEIANQVGFPLQNLILGGDHLGPVCWANEPAEQAMAKAGELIAAYVAAGFKKIHLDTSMCCADDGDEVSDLLVAQRASELCAIAEATAVREFGESNIVYVVGTEVPPPGGASEAIDSLQVTPVSAARETIEHHRQAFKERKLESAWERVIALVVQPGVEFDHTTVHDYQPQEASELSQLIDDTPNLVYEAHSTDYQPAAAYHALVRDHFAILKVGPQLTYALREAIFALSFIEDELLEAGKRSEIRAVCERVMLEEPDNWHKYYPLDTAQSVFYRRYSYSDRIRYYWNKPAIGQAVDQLFENLQDQPIPLPLLNQFMPVAYLAVRSGAIQATPEALVRHHIMQVTQVYADACWRNQH